MLCRWNQHSVVSQLVCYCRWVGQLCLTLCNPFDCNTPGFPVPHRLLELAQVQVHCISDAIQPSHPMMPSSPSSLNLYSNQWLFRWVNYLHQFSSLQSLSHVWLFATPWTAARQASLSITNSQTLLKLMSIESVMPSNDLILCHPLLLLPSIFPSIRVFSNESASAGQSIGASASASVLPMNIQDWFPLWLTGLISLLPKGLSRVFFNTQFKSINTVLKGYCSGLPFPSPGDLSNTGIEPASPILAGRFFSLTHQHLYTCDIHNCGHLPSVYYVPRTVLKSILQMPFYVIFIETLSDNAITFTMQVKKLS